jgi:hypothetical protein
MKSFSHKADLVMHIRVHNGDKCLKKISTKSSLDRHISMHVCKSGVTIPRAGGRLVIIYLIRPKAGRIDPAKVIFARQDYS